MSDDLVALVNRLQCGVATHDDISDAADLIGDQQDRLAYRAAEITRLRAAIERLAQWHDAHAAHYEDEERNFNALPDGMSIAANFAQAKFQHRQRASAIRAALEGGKDE